MKKHMVMKKLMVLILLALFTMGSSCDDTTTTPPGPVFEVTRVDVRMSGSELESTLVVNVLEPLLVPHYRSVLTIMMQCYNELPIASQHMHVYEVMDSGETRLMIIATGYNDPPFAALTSRADGGWTTGFTLSRLGGTPEGYILPAGVYQVYLWITATDGTTSDYIVLDVTFLDDPNPVE